MLVFIFIFQMSNEDMKKKCNKKPKVRQYANMRVICDNQMLAVKKRKDHSHCDCGCIVKKMDDGIGEKDGLFHS
jgi:uracil DNA glycosylase